MTSRNRSRGLVRRLGATATLSVYVLQLMSCGGPDATDRPERLSHVPGALQSTPPPPPDTTPLDVPENTILPSPAGPSTAQTPFEADVTTDGASSIRIPLWVPRGRAGLQPNLAIAYNSRGGDGPLGVGFALEGLSAIAPCGRSFGGVSFAPNLRTDPHRFVVALCLDGQILRPSGASEYRTERDAYVKIVADGIPDHGVVPSWFTVYTREGLILRYGLLPERSDGLLQAKVNGVTLRLQWALVATEDRFGNRMDVFYDKPPENAPDGTPQWLRPQRIEYTRQLSPAAPARRTVTFTYENRPDPFSGFQWGAPVARTFRMSRIDMSGPDRTGQGTEALRSYRLSYRNDSVSQRSLLRQVQECDGAGTCKQPVRFDWKLGSWAFRQQTLGPFSSQLTNVGLHALGLGSGRFGVAWGHHVTWLGKVDGADLYEEGFHTLAMPDGSNTPGVVATPSELTATSGWQPAAQCPARDSGLRPQLIDFEGFGKSEVAALSCGFAPDQVHRTYFYDLEAFLPGQLALLGSRAHGVFFFDANGDRTADAVFQEPDKITFFNPFSHQILTSTNVFAEWPSSTLQSTVGVRTVDLDGSGRIAVVGPMTSQPGDMLQSVRKNGPAGQALVVSTNTGLGIPFWGSDSPTDPEAAYPLWYGFADVNGDSLADAVTIGRAKDSATNLRIDVQLNQGDPDDGSTDLGPHFGPLQTMTFLNEATALYGRKVRTGDFDGDGRMDLLFVGNGAPPVLWRAGPLGTFPPANRVTLPIPAGDDTELQQLVDVNFDGLTDVTARVSSTIYAWIRLDGADVITRVHGGTQLPTPDGYTGLNYAFEYKPLAYGPSVYTSSVTDTAHIRRADESMQVVTRMSMNAGAELRRSWTYQYKDGRFETNGRGWLGFGQRTVTDEQLSTTVTATYDALTEAKYCGRALRTAFLPRKLVETTPLPTGPRVRQVDWRYLSDDTSASPCPSDFSIYQQYATDVREQVFENGQPLRDETTTTKLDANGNLVEERHKVRWMALDGTAQQNETRLTSADVDFDTANWIPRGAWTLNQGWERCAAPLIPSWSLFPPSCPTWAPAETHATKVAFGTKGEIATTEQEPSLAGHVPAEGESSHYLRTTLTRNAAGLVTETTLDTGSETRRAVVAYDLVDQTRLRHQELRVASPGQPEQFVGVVRYAFHPGLGVLAQTSDANDVRTWYQYDGFGRPREITPGYGSQGPLLKNHTHFDDTWQDGLPRRHVAAQDASVPSLPILSEAITRLDSIGRPVLTQSTGFDGQLVTQATTYDAFGRVTQRDVPRSAAEQAAATPAYDWFRYDALGRVIAQGHDGTQLSTVTYQPGVTGMSVTTTSAEQRARMVVVDARGLMVESIDGSNNDNPVQTTYAYGAFDKPVAIDAPQNQIIISYDGHGARTQSTSTVRGTDLTASDAFGQVRWEKGAGDATGTHYVHDTLGRMIEVDSPKATTTIKWDEAHGIGQVDWATRVPTDLSSAPVTLDHVYDALGRQVETDTIVDGAVLTTSSTYDDLGRPETLTFPDRADGSHLTLRYGYGSNGQLVSISRDGSPQPYWTALARNGVGQLTRERFGNGIERTHVYDDLGQVRFLEALLGTAPIQRNVYDYSPDGDLVTRHRLVQPVPSTERFTYDHLDRLVRWESLQKCPSDVMSYAYADDGTLRRRDVLSGTGVPATYSSEWEPEGYGGYQAIKAATYGTALHSYEYDQKGNQIRALDGSGQLERGIDYTELDLPHIIKQGTAVTLFEYDAFGARTRKITTNGADVVSATTYASGMYQKRLSPAGVVHVYEIVAPQGPVAEVTWPEGGSQEVTYVLDERQGSPEVVTSEDGTPVGRYAWDPFGERRNPSDLAQPVSGSATRGRLDFTGHELDDEMGLVNMRGRMFDPRLGRFLTPDPVVSNPASSQAYNPYSYVTNNPTRYTDPSGFAQDPTFSTCIGSECSSVQPSGGGASSSAVPYVVVSANTSLSPSEDAMNYLGPPRLRLASDNSTTTFVANAGDIGSGATPQASSQVVSPATAPTNGRSCWEYPCLSGPDEANDRYKMDQQYLTLELPLYKVPLVQGFDPYKLGTYALLQSLKHSIYTPWFGPAEDTGYVGKHGQWISSPDQRGHMDRFVALLNLAALAFPAPRAAKAAEEAVGVGEAIVEATTVGQGKVIALGIRENLADFAKSVGGSIWKDWAANNPAGWRSAFLDMANNPANRINVNLTGVDDPWLAVTRAAASRGGATDWELLQIKNNTGWWERVTFFKDGAPVVNPFQ